VPELLIRDPLFPEHPLTNWHKSVCVPGETSLRWQDSVLGTLCRIAANYRRRAENALQNIHDGKLYEVQKHLTLSGHNYNSAYVAVSENWLQGLKELQRKAILDALDEATRWQVDYIARKDSELLETLKKAGMQVTEPDKEAFRQATAPAYDAFYAKFGDDARAFVEAVRKMWPDNRCLLPGTVERRGGPAAR
jgi:hypothetical protein